MARREVEANTRLLKLLALDGDPSTEALDAFRRDQQRLDREIKALVARLEALLTQQVDDELGQSGIAYLLEQAARASLCCARATRRPDAARRWRPTMVDTGQRVWSAWPRRLLFTSTLPASAAG